MLRDRWVLAPIFGLASALTFSADPTQPQRTGRRRWQMRPRL